MIGGLTTNAAAPSTTLARVLRPLSGRGRLPGNRPLSDPKSQAWPVAILVWAGTAPGVWFRPGLGPSRSG